MPICQECGCESNEQVVCIECFEQMVSPLLEKIRSLQGEVLGLTATNDLLALIAKAKGNKSKE